jgi:hypothetical protein
MVGYSEKKIGDKNRSQHYSVIWVTRPSYVFHQQHNDLKFSAGIALERSFPLHISRRFLDEHNPR